VRTALLFNQIEETVSRRRQESATNIFSRDYLVMKPLIRWLKNVACPYASGVLVDFDCCNKPYFPFFQTKSGRYIGVDITQNVFNLAVVLEIPNALSFDDNSIGPVLSTQVPERVLDGSSIATATQSPTQRSFSYGRFGGLWIRPTASFQYER
jgi:hypothetical protein